MKQKRELLIIFVLLLLAWFLVAGNKNILAQQAVITVGPNVQASKSRSDVVHNEVLLAADRSNSKNLLGCTMAFSPELNKVSTMAYVSHDNGTTWNFAVGNDTGILSGDPACTFGADGKAYFVAIERSTPANDRVVVYRSTDYGKTWSPATTLLGSAPSADRPYIIVDQTTSKYSGRVYIYGQIAQRTVDGEFAGLSLALWHSLDGGVTFEGPVVRSRDKSFSYQPANGVVLSDGTLVCLIAEVDSQKRNDGYGGSQYRKADVQNGFLKVVTSTDGGESLNTAFKVSDLYADWREESTGIPSLALDRDSPAFKDRLYAAWADGRYGRTQILVSYSADKGKTWSTPHVVSDSQSTAGDGPDSFMPVAAVNPDGIVGAMWYDKRDVRGGLGYYVRFATSLDGGETWQTSVRVSESPKTFETQAPWPITAGVWRNSGGALSLNLNRFEWIAGGHTAGLAADASGTFHPFWVDNRTGVSQIWTASILVRGKVARNGSPELAELDDLSASTMLELAGCNYEKNGNILSCNARLKNTSKESLAGPLRLRVISLRSELGEPRILNADNGQDGTGAVWSFGEDIKPGESSQNKLIRFQILNPRDFRQESHFKSTFVSMEVRVLGQKRKTADKVSVPHDFTVS